MVLLPLLAKMETETTDIKGLTIHKLLKNKKKKNLSFLSLCMGFSGKNTSPEDRPNLGIECAFPPWQVEWHH